MAIPQGGRITVIGAGIVGIASALYLQRAGYRVDVLDKLPPGEGCSFGNAGLISPSSCVPFSMPDMAWRVPRYLADPLGPLAIRWSYLPQALPWLLRFLAAGRPGRVQEVSRAMAALHGRCFEAYAPLLKAAGEVRPVQRGQERLKEAAKLGFTQALIPKANKPKQAIAGLEVFAVERVEQAVARLRDAFAV